MFCIIIIITYAVDNAYLQVAEYFLADKPKTVDGGTLVCRRTLLVLTSPSRV